MARSLISPNNCGGSGGCGAPTYNTRPAGRPAGAAAAQVAAMYEYRYRWPRALPGLAQPSLTCQSPPAASPK